MSLTPAYIDMEEGWRWWPNTFSSRHQPKLAVPQELLDEHAELSKRWYALQSKFEQLYRVQEGLEPWHSDPVPEHRVL